MVKVGPLPRVQVGHEVEHAVVLHDTVAGLYRDVVGLLHRQRGQHLQVGIDHDHVAHFAGAHIVHAVHAGGVEQGLVNGRHFFFVHSAVHQVVHGFPGELPAHFGDHEAHDQCRNGVQNGVASQVANDAQGHHQ